MNKSESIKNLASALAQFQGEVANPKNSADNPFFKSKYAPLNEVINTVKPLLAKHGLSVLQSPSGDGQNIVITTLLMHSSGEWIEGDPLILKADKVTAQGAGSAITYGRRYALSAILGIASEEDDDANHATGNTQQPRQTQHKAGQQDALKPLAEVRLGDPLPSGTIPVKCTCGKPLTPGIIKYCKQNNINPPTCIDCRKKENEEFNQIMADTYVSESGDR